MALYLVTGGCGFIGSHLSAALIGRGDAVRVLDDLSTGSEANLAPRAHLLRGDVADAALVQRAMDGVAGCFHLAAVASVERGVRDWLGTHRTNLSGSIAVFDAARAAGPGGGPVPVVYASSAAVYGDAATLPIAEDAPTRPLSAYGADKLGCEQHARVGGATHGLPTLGLRFFNVFGPRQDPRSPYSGVISIFCDRLARGEAVTVFGDGGQTRDFIHVSDVVAALLTGLGAATTDAPVLNVCTGQRTSVAELAAAVATACGTPLQLRHEAARAGEIRHSVGSAARAAAMLGVVARMPLGEGLAGVVAWLRAGRPGLA
ncbi:MAG: NAD-dependent epimerase/dehydratase family protein [Acetobacteraceae bacterium]|nr:NAD-dependent epimerase/dehydratase family protein [Acetobacteraceae bacterium]